MLPINKEKKTWSEKPFLLFKAIELDQTKNDFVFFFQTWAQHARCKTCNQRFAACCTYVQLKIFLVPIEQFDEEEMLFKIKAEIQSKT